MRTDNINTPRVTQSAAPYTQALTPNEGAKPSNTVRMTRAEWKATPRDYKCIHRNAEGKIAWRSVMRTGTYGPTLYPVEIVD